MTDLSDPARALAPDAPLNRIAAALERLAPPPQPAPDFSEAHAFVWHPDPDRLQPVHDVARVPLSALVGIDRARDTLLANTLQLMARNRRLFVLPQLARQLQALIAEERGEVTAEVTSAVALTDDQQTRLRDTLAQKSGKKVKLNTRVDEALIGGMIVKLGSQMIDSSIRSKLASLQNAMKEVG